MIPVKALERCLGREVHVYGTSYDDDGDLRQVLSGRLVAIEEGCLAIGSEDVKPGEVDWLVDLRLVGAVALQVAKAEKALQVVDGGKVRRLKVEEPQPA